jgi:hypothetical protein
MAFSKKFEILKVGGCELPGADLQKLNGTYYSLF